MCCVQMDLDFFCSEMMLGSEFGTVYDAKIAGGTVMVCYGIKNEWTIKRSLCNLLNLTHGLHHGLIGQINT